MYLSIWEVDKNRVVYRYAAAISHREVRSSSPGMDLMVRAAHPHTLLSGRQPSALAWSFSPTTALSCGQTPRPLVVKWLPSERLPAHPGVLQGVCARRPGLPIASVIGPPPGSPVDGQV